MKQREFKVSEKNKSYCNINIDIDNNIDNIILQIVLLKINKR